MPPRVISILCLLQFLVICSAYLSCSWGLRIAEKIHSDDWLEATGWWRMVMTVKWLILLWLMIPVSVAWCCARLSNSHRDIAWVGPDGIWLAIAITLLVGWLFGAAFFMGMFPPERRQPITIIDW